MADDKLITIKKIRTAAGEHEIEAKYLGGYTFEEIQGMVQGVSGTFVISETKNTIEGYETVVKSDKSTVVTTTSELNTLTGNTESYKVGDIILMEELSDGEKIFDRWVSKVDGDNITLAVLETQVAKHHHTIEHSTDVALTGVDTTTTVVIPAIGNEVTVLTGASGDVLTSLDVDTYKSTGGHDLTLVEVTEGGDGILGHSHTITSHEHSVSFNPNTFVSGMVEAYTVLSTDTFTQHTHDTVDVAGTYTDGEVIVYATGEGTTDTFIKTLVDSEEIATSVLSSFDSGANTVGLVTSVQTSDDEIGDLVKTTTSGGHTHTVSGETSEVITGVTIADNVITSVSLNYTAPTVQSDVVTSVSHTYVSALTSITATPTTSSFFNNCTVDNNGVLSFGSDFAVTEISVSDTKASVVNEVSFTSGEQIAGSATISAMSFVQSFVSGKATFTTSTDTAGEHTHGFSHTHSIPEHTHTIGAHSHTYKKSVSGETGDAYTSLTKLSYVPHTHASNVSVAAVQSDGSEKTYVTGGTKTSVVMNLVDVDQTYNTTGGAEMTTDTKYSKVSGGITFPTLTFNKKTLSTTEITPAVVGNETAIKSITFTSDNFVKNVSEKTSVNIGGEPKTENEGE